MRICEHAKMRIQCRHVAAVPLFGVRKRPRNWAHFSWQKTGHGSKKNPVFLLCVPFSPTLTPKTYMCRPEKTSLFKYDPDGQLSHNRSVSNTRVYLLPVVCLPEQQQQQHQQQRQQQQQQKQQLQLSTTTTTTTIINNDINSYNNQQEQRQQHQHRQHQ